MKATAQLRSAASRLVAGIGAALRRVLEPLPPVAAATCDLFRSRAELVAENALLRQQLIIAARKVGRPKLRAVDRGLFVLLAGRTRSWRDTLLLVKPETVLRWHREGFRLLWKWKSRRTKATLRRTDESTASLIRRLARENRLYVKPPVMWRCGGRGRERGPLGLLCFT